MRRNGEAAGGEGASPKEEDDGSSSEGLEEKGLEESELVEVGVSSEAAVLTVGKVEEEEEMSSDGIEAGRG